MILTLHQDSVKLRPSAQGSLREGRFNYTVICHRDSNYLLASEKRLMAVGRPSL